MPRYNGISQKQRDFIEYYTSPTSPTYDNASKSAIRAGYSEQYALKTAHKTLVPLVKEHTQKTLAAHDEAEARRVRILNKAEENIEEYVHMQPETDTDKKIKANLTTFAAERLGKNYYSTRVENVNSGREVIAGDTREVLELTLRKYLAPLPPPNMHDVRDNGGIEP